MEPSTPSVRRLDEIAGPDHSLFVYGTLQFPEILEVLIGRVPRHEPATAPGWRAAALPGVVYPGLVPAPTAAARGIILHGLTAPEWHILDAFEDNEYTLRTIQLATSPAWTYVWTAATTQSDWHPDHFAAAHLPEFVTRTAEWRRAVTPPA